MDDRLAERKTALGNQAIAAGQQGVMQAQDQLFSANRNLATAGYGLGDAATAARNNAVDDAYVAKMGEARLAGTEAVSGLEALIAKIKQLGSTSAQAAATAEILNMGAAADQHVQETTFVAGFAPGPARARAQAALPAVRAAMKGAGIPARP
jgi:hypothetical protein